MESFARWVSSREYRAGLAAAGLSLVPLLSFLSGGVLVLMRLQKGAPAGWRAGALAAAVLLAVGMAAGAPVFAVASAAAVWVPALALAGQLAGSGSFSRVALAALAGAAGVAVVTHWVVRDPVAVWGPVIGELMATIGPADVTVSEDLVAVLAQAMPGIAAASLFLAVMIALLLGMWWHASLTSPGAFGNAFRNLRLGKVPVIVTGLVYLLAQAAGWPVGRSLVLVLFSGLALQGLAVVHGVAAARGWPVFVLGVVYLCVVVAAPYALMALAMLAVADAWMDFRTRARQARP